MFFSKKLFLVSLYVISILFVVNPVHSTCIVEPTDIEIRSGGKSIGNFNPDSPNQIFINGNLSVNNLLMKFIFDNNEKDCYNGASSMGVKLFPSSSTVGADLVEEVPIPGRGFVSTFEFLFDEEVEVSGLFTSVYSVESVNGDTSASSISFNLDRDAPIFSNIMLNPNGPIYSRDDNVTLEFRVSDSQSGLRTVRYDGETINLNGNTTFDEIYTFKMNADKLLTVVAEDIIGNENNFNISLIVDSKAPTLEDFSGRYFANQGSRSVDYKVKITDDSFAQSGETPDVTGNFSRINSQFGNVQGVCSRDSNVSFICNFRSIRIDLDKTESKNIVISAVDEFNNSVSKTFTESVSVDFDAPIINEFKLINSIGGENTINSKDSGAYVVVEFSDESINFGNQLSFATKFGTLPRVNGNCEYKNNSKGICKWQLKDVVSKYDGSTFKTELFQVAIQDIYGNLASDNFTVTVDNIDPVVKNITLIETQSIRDGIISSQEEIRFRVIVSDRNMFSDGYFVTGDFSSIDFDNGSQDIKGDCLDLNTNDTQCDFEGIIVENGYINGTLKFNISDAAGNLVVEKFPVEVLKINNETVSSYSISNVRILNPINRNFYLSNDANGWFEGKIDLKGDRNMRLVNYQLKGCNASDLDPLIFAGAALFPEEVIFNDGRENADEFALKAELKRHSNSNDMNRASMTCFMSIIKRDEQRLYNPEIVEFDLIFDFYDTPRDDLIKANAQKILEMSEEIDYLGGWFDSIYDIYNILSNLCSLVSGGGGAISGALEGWALIRVGTGFANPAEVGLSATDTTLTFEQNSLSKLLNEPDSPIKIACDFVTCSNGGILGSALSGALDEGSGTFSDLTSFYNNICSLDFSGIGGDEK